MQSVMRIHMMADTARKGSQATPKCLQSDSARLRFYFESKLSTPPSCNANRYIWNLPIWILLHLNTMASAHAPQVGAVEVKPLKATQTWVHMLGYIQKDTV